MSKQVYITDEGIIEILVIGDQTYDSVNQLGTEAENLQAKLRQAHQPVLVLDNLLQIGTVPPDARRLVVDYMKNVAYDRLAMVGTHPLLRFGANLMFQASGKGNRLKFFDTRAAAVQWLQACKRV